MSSTSLRYYPISGTFDLRPPRAGQSTLRSARTYHTGTRARMTCRLSVELVLQFPTNPRQSGTANVSLQEVSIHVVHRVSGCFDPDKLTTYRRQLKHLKVTFVNFNTCLRCCIYCIRFISDVVAEMTFLSSLLK